MSSYLDVYGFRLLPTYNHPQLHTPYWGCTDLHVHASVTNHLSALNSMGLVNCKSIADLPSIQTLETSRDITFVTLPLVILSLNHEPNWGFGFLLVTDFTHHHESSYYHEKLPKKLPEEFFFGGRQIERSQVFSISVPHAKVDQTWSEIKKFSPRMERYHYLSLLNSNISMEGVVGLVNFRVKAHNGSVEGMLSKVLICNRRMLLIPANKERANDHHFKEFMDRYASNLSSDLYDSLLPAFPILDYVKRSSVPQRHPQPNVQNGNGNGNQYQNQNQNQPLNNAGSGTTHLQTQNATVQRTMITQSEPPQKVRKLAAAQVVFRQQFTQTQQPQLPESSQEFSDTSHVSLNHTQPGQELSRISEQSSPILRQHTGIVDYNSEISGRNFNLFAINEVEFLMFAKIPCHMVKPGTSFVTKCQVHSLHPEAGNILSKPFKRTLKIPLISLFLAKGTDLVKVEFHTEDEKCRFLGIAEPEEAINSIAKITRSLKKLSGTEIDITIDKRSMCLDFGYERPYWSSATTLEKMTKPV